MLQASSRSRLRIATAVSAMAIVGVGSVLSAGAASGQTERGPAATNWAPDGPAPPYGSAWSEPFEAPDEGSASRLGLSAPVLDGETLVAVAPESVIGVELDTGEEAFEPVARDFGPPATPAVTDVGDRHVVVFAEGFGPAAEGEGGTASPTPTPTAEASDEEEAPFDSRLRAVDLETGKDVWDPVPLDRVSRTGVTVADGLALVGDNAGTITAVDLSDGSVAWTADAGEAVLNRLAATGDVVIAGTQASRQTAATISAFDLEDGRRTWQHDTETGLQTGTPLVVGDLIVTAVTDQSGRASLVTLDVQNGAERWTTMLTSQVTIGSTLAATGDTVVVVDARGEAYGVAFLDGRIRWSFAENRSVFRGGPVVSGDSVVFGTEDGTLAAVDLDSGHMVWRSAPAEDLPVRALTVDGDRLIATRGGSIGSVLALEHTDGALLDEVSPTVADPVRIAGLFLVAAVPLGLVLILGGGWLRQRFPPSELPDSESELDAGGDPDEFAEDDE